MGFLAVSVITLATVALFLTMAVMVFLTARVMRDVLHEHRLTKEVERQAEEDRRAHQLMLIAGGSAGVNFNAQQLAVAMLADYPRAANSLEQLHAAINRFAIRGGDGDMGRWRELNVQIMQTLNQIKPHSTHPDRTRTGAAA